MLTEFGIHYRLESCVLYFLYVRLFEGAPKEACFIQLTVYRAGVFRPAVLPREAACDWPDLGEHQEIKVMVVVMIGRGGSFLKGG